MCESDEIVFCFVLSEPIFSIVVFVVEYIERERIMMHTTTIDEYRNINCRFNDRYPESLLKTISSSLLLLLLTFRVYHKELQFVQSI